MFGRAPASEGLTWQEGTIIQHHAFRTGQAGLVELWEVEAEEKSAETPAFEPWNEEAAGARSVDALCKRIAATIKGWVDVDEQLASKGRPVRAGDILILVRRRDPFTTPMIRELKRLGVPVAGADRMKLTDQLAVQDLVALADFLLMPDDDLTLAVLLKSPLFGFDDDDLFALAHERKGSLWSSLRAKANERCALRRSRRIAVGLAYARRTPSALRVLLRAARRRWAAIAPSDADEAWARGRGGDR